MPDHLLYLALFVGQFVAGWVRAVSGAKRGGWSMDMISIGEAAVLLQPTLGTLSAFNLLADWRRKKPLYADRIFTPPRFTRMEGRIAYPRSEILRVIREIEEKRRLPLGLMV